MSNNLKLKIMIKKYKSLEIIVRYIAIPFFYIKRLSYLIGYFARKLNLTSRYSEIKKFKNTHYNERCFIIATGPSLTIEDLEKLNNEYTFSMNSIVMAYEETNWRPTYYGIQDEYVYKNLEEKILNSDMKNIFVGGVIPNIFNIPVKSIQFPLDYLNHKLPNSKYKTKFSKDCYLTVYDGYTITYSLIQIAIYMGFKEIYLLGADATYNSKKRHFREHGVIDKTENKAGERMQFAYEVAKKFAEENGVTIYNATRGGALELFPRVDLDKIV